MRTNDKKTKVSYLILAGLFIAILSSASNTDASTVGGLTFEYSPMDSIYVEESVTVTATLMTTPTEPELPAPIQNEEIIFSFSIDEKATWTPFGAWDTNEYGVASEVFSPDEFQSIVDDGSHVYFKVESVSLSRSSMDYVTVNFRDTYLTLGLSRNYMAASETAALVATLTYQVTTGESSDVTEAPIDIQFQTDLDSTWRSASGSPVNTNGAGEAPLSFIPSENGIGPGSTVEFMAVFEGSFGFRATNSDVTGPLQLAPAGSVPEYALGGLVALAACLAAFVTVRRLQKTKSNTL